MTQKTNADTLTNELIYNRFLMSNGQTRRHFKELNTPEYVALHIIEDSVSADDAASGKAYLRDIAEKMQIPVRRAGKLAGELRDRGLVRWLHDGDGDEGTYVVITDAGLRLMENQEKRFRAYYGRVIEKYGRDEMIRLLGMMKRLEDVMRDEWKETEVDADADGENE